VAAAPQSAAVEVGAGMGEPVGDERPVRGACVACLGRELLEDEGGVLPGARAVAQHGGMPTPRVAVQGVEVGDETGAQRIEVDVAHQLEQVRVFFDERRIEAILEEVPDAVVAAVEGRGVAAEEPAHRAGQRCGAGPEQEVHVVRHEAPGIEAQVAGRDAGGEAIEEVVAVTIVGEDGAAFDAAHDDVVERVRGIETWAAGHGRHPGEAEYIACQVSFKMTTGDAASIPPNPRYVPEILPEILLDPDL
jgi:hypothetical protein